MKKSLQTFMNGIIDYAGLFPPADLSLDEAITNYAAYQKSDDVWILSRFIIPAAQLNRLSPYAGELFNRQHVFDFSVLGSATDTVDDYHAEMENVCTCCESFCTDHPGAVTTQMLEMKLPLEAAYSHDSALLKELMDATAQTLSESTYTPDTIFYEGRFDESWKKDMEAVLQAIESHNAGSVASDHYHQAAFKVRCGGVEAHQFPSVEQVSFVLTQAREHNVALKGTAGLHHPVRHYDDSVNTKMDGFFNVFGGAMLGYANDLKATELQDILSEEDAEQFVFADHELRWKDYSVSTEEMEELRKTALLSYGSCSFDDPREDLQKLKLF